MNASRPSRRACLLPSSHNALCHSERSEESTFSFVLSPLSFRTKLFYFSLFFFCHSEPACRRQAKRGICFFLSSFPTSPPAIPANLANYSPWARSSPHPPAAQNIDTHRYSRMLPQRSTPPHHRAPAFSHPPPLPPRDCFHQRRPSPRSTPPSPAPRFSARTPAQTPNFFRPPQSPSPVNSPLHPRLTPRLVQDLPPSIPPVAALKIPPLPPPASHRSYCRNTFQIPSPPPRDVPDEIIRPSPAPIQNMRSRMPRPLLLPSPPFFRRPAIPSPPPEIAAAMNISQLLAWHLQSSLGPAASVQTTAPFLFRPAHRSPPALILSTREPPLLISRLSPPKDAAALYSFHQSMRRTSPMPGVLPAHPQAFAAHPAAFPPAPTRPPIKEKSPPSAHRISSAIPISLFLPPDSLHLEWDARPQNTLFPVSLAPALSAPKPPLQISRQPVTIAPALQASRAPLSPSPPPAREKTCSNPLLLRHIANNSSNVAASTASRPEYQSPTMFLEKFGAPVLSIPP